MKTRLLKPATLFSILFIAGLIAIGLFLWFDYSQAMPLDAQPHYVGRQSCIECHQQQASLYHGSDHDLAMDIATDQTVLGDFNNQTLEHYGLTSRMYRDGKKFMVQTDGPTGKMEDFEVKYVLGVHPLQQYMVELDRPEDAAPNEIGRVQVLRISWDTQKKKWFYLMPSDVDERLEPDDPLHWTGITQNWNTSCAYCHSTHLEKNFNSQQNEYRTTFSEIDVSCEACHGPGSLHVEIAQHRWFFWDRHHKYGLVNLKTESNLPQIETCAPCHSRRGKLADGFRPGCNFDDYFSLQLLTPLIYHADGQIREEDYVYGSFLQSKMFQSGIRCSDCHDPHSAKTKLPGNDLCTSCHQHPAGKYDTPAHHHHEAGTPGAQCVECHMPETTYMQVDPRRDHSLRVPRPDLSLRLGTPNACTGCHLDPAQLPPNPKRKPLNQYLDWIIQAESGDTDIKKELERIDRKMLDAVQQWYPPETTVPPTQYFETLAVGQSARETSLDALTRLALDQTAPAIIRATAAVGLAEDRSPLSFDTAMKALDDADPKVVAAALQRIDAETQTIQSRLQYGNATETDRQQLKTIVEHVGPLLTHSSRLVRLQAVQIWIVLQTSPDDITAGGDYQQAFERALDEYQQSLRIDGSHAQSHMMLGVLHERLNEPEKAKDDYRAAITIAPDLTGPRSNLAALLETEANQLRQQIRRSQSEGGIPAHQLKTIFGQIQRLGKEAKEYRRQEHERLKKDIERAQGLPNTHGLHYRFAMSCYMQGDLASAEKHLLEAVNQQPENPTYLLGLAAYYLHVRKPQSASRYIIKLLEIDPDNEGYRALMRQARQQMLNQ